MEPASEIKVNQASLEKSSPEENEETAGPDEKKEFDSKETSADNPPASTNTDDDAAATSGENPADEESDDTSTTGSEDSDADISPTEDLTELVINATTLKDEGNAHFKAGDFDKAVQSYRKGANRLKPLNKNNTGDEQVKALLLSLQNNLSMVYFKLNKTKLSRDVATRVLKIDSTNVKALYRRAVAHRKMGDLEKARDDLKEAMKSDTDNVAVKKELASVKKELIDHKQKQKKALSTAFSKNSGSLYGDKELEKQRKLEEERRKKEEEEKAREKRKKEWEDECVSRMAKNEEAISFDDWEKEQKEKAKKQKKEEAKKREQERKARAAAREAAAASKKAGSDSDDDELTAAELAMMRGYKKTADGRTTSYFTREQSDHEKRLIGDIAPQRLDAVSSPPQLITPSPSSDGVQKGRPSVWNQAGTWEEKDTTDWCKEHLESRLKTTTCTVQSDASEQFRAKVIKVESLTGDASVAIIGGKKRYIFDFHAKLKFEVWDATGDEQVAKGSLHLPDICSTSHDELEVNFTGWKDHPSSSQLEHAIKCQHELINQIRVNVHQWVEDFNQMY